MHVLYGFAVRVCQVQSLPISCCSVWTLTTQFVPEAICPQIVTSTVFKVDCIQLVIEGSRCDEEPCDRTTIP